MNDARKALVKRLMDSILKGDIVKNGKLPSERDLATAFRTSRQLVREALISLEALGILDIRERQGIFVAGAGRDDSLRGLGLAQVWPMEALSQIMEIRRIIDPEATALAAMRRSDDDLSRLDECLRRLEGIHAQRDPDEASQGAYWNTVLHAAVFKATGNTLLARLYESLLELSEKGISAMRMDILESSDSRRNEQVIEEHRELVASIRDQDAERARAASKVHLGRTIETLVELSRATPLSGFLERRTIDL